MAADQVPVTPANTRREILAKDPLPVRDPFVRLLLGALWIGLVLWMRIDRVAFLTTTPTGGDNAAHVWTADFVRREMLPNLRLTGWSNDWFGGVPVLSFYFPVPTWAIVFLSFVLPYATSFKLVTIIGIVTLPLAAHFLGARSAIGPTRSLFLVLSAYTFLLLRHYRILGGNILSTMAGEFSFSISLTLMVVYAALLTHVLRTGRFRARTAVILALAGMSHIVPTILALIYTACALLTELRRDRWKRQVADVIVTGGTGGALAAFWIIPFASNMHLTNAMDYERYTKFVRTLFPFFSGSYGLQIPREGIAIAAASIVLAALASIWGIVRRDRFVLTWTLTWALSGVAFRIAPQGAMWNIRLLPLWYFCSYLLAGQALAVAARAVFRRRLTTAHHETDPPARVDVAQPLTGGAADLVSNESGEGAAIATAEMPPAVVSVRRRVRTKSHGPLVVGLFVAFITIFPAMKLMPGFVPVLAASKQGLTISSFSKTKDFENAARPFGWAASNYDGAERKSGWPEYERLLDTLKGRPCGRLLWEPDKRSDKGMIRYGSQMALMALPYWTKSCIQTSEGLFFESSASTPFHWMTVAFVADKPSNPQRRLPYPSFDMERGVQRMRELGIRYYLAWSEKATTAADANAGLQRLANSKPFTLYEVRNHAIVEGLASTPVVARGVRSGLEGGFADVAIAQWVNPDAFKETIALNGPADWERRAVTITEPKPTPGVLPKRGVGVTVASGTTSRFDPADVTDVTVGQTNVRFRVSEPGKPVLVRVSYFPNWKVRGARGPYRVAPNFMVVVPTSRDVELYFGRSTAEIIGHTVSLFGLVALVGLTLTGRRRRRNDQPHDQPRSEVCATFLPQSNP